MYEEEGNKLKNCCVVENIEPQQKLRESDEMKDNEENSSPTMYKTKSKQGSEEKWGNLSNVFKKILKQSIEGSFCLRKLRSKASREVWNIAPMG